MYYTCIPLTYYKPHFHNACMLVGGEATYSVCSDLECELCTPSSVVVRCVLHVVANLADCCLDNRKLYQCTDIRHIFMKPTVPPIAELSVARQIY